MTVLPNINAAESNTATISDDCTHRMSNEMHAKAATLDEAKAISLGSVDVNFKSAIQGYDSTFATVFNTWHLNKIDCTVSWNDVNVGYVLSDSNGYVKNVVVTLDPSLTKVIGINSYVAPHFSNHTSPTWSGYEIGTAGQKATEGHMVSTIPTISQATTSTNKCVPTVNSSPGCDLAVWTGLEDGSNHIAQAGSDGNLTCNNSSCTSPTFKYFLWYEEYPHPAFTCNNALITGGDSVTSDVTYTGTVGATGFYNISVQDTSASYGCSVTNYGFEMTNPTAAPFIDERANYTTTIDELAKFSFNTMTGSIAFNGGALGSITTAEVLVSDNMKNPTTQNISVGAISSGAFKQYYTTSTGT